MEENKRKKEEELKRIKQEEIDDEIKVKREQEKLIEKEKNELKIENRNKDAIDNLINDNNHNTKIELNNNTNNEQKVIIEPIKISPKKIETIREVKNTDINNNFFNDTSYKSEINSLRNEFKNIENNLTSEINYLKNDINVVIKERNKYKEELDILKKEFDNKLLKYQEQNITKQNNFNTNINTNFNNTDNIFKDKKVDNFIDKSKEPELKKNINYKYVSRRGEFNNDSKNYPILKGQTNFIGYDSINQESNIFNKDKQFELNKSNISDEDFRLKTSKIYDNFFNVNKPLLNNHNISKISNNNKTNLNDTYNKTFNLGDSINYDYINNIDKIIEKNNNRLNKIDQIGLNKTNFDSCINNLDCLLDKYCKN